MELKKLIVDLSGLMSIGGFERFEREKLISLVGDEFDENYLDNVGNQIFVKKCGRENDDEIIYFNAVGAGILDLAVVTRCYKKALEQNKGIKIPYWED